jgi:hypothetical protein
MALFSYGSAAFMYSRSNHEYNRHVHPVFHPWAIILGCGLLPTRSAFFIGTDLGKLLKRRFRRKMNWVEKRLTTVGPDRQI